ncbi:hypothetical protein TNCV_2198791 [Trichonephila clavipes]|nr:hypothetical protein TNCV_2198791 [Trichonephila clavipes]
MDSTGLDIISKLARLGQRKQMSPVDIVACGKVFLYLSLLLLIFWTAVAFPWDSLEIKTWCVTLLCGKAQGDDDVAVSVEDTRGSGFMEEFFAEVRDSLIFL